MSKKYDKIESPFQLINHSVEQLHIVCGVSSLVNTDVHVINHIGFKVIEIVKSGDLLFGKLNLTIKVTCKKSEDRRKTVKCDIALVGMFQGDLKQIDNEESFEKMLVINGIASLYSIARSVLISASSQCLINGQVRLPMINVLNLIAEPSPEDHDEIPK